MPAGAVQALRGAAVAIDPRMLHALPGKTLPKRVAIVAMGASSAEFVKIANAQGGVDTMGDEVWTINATAAVIAHHRAFVMDDIKVNIADEAKRNFKVAQGILRWLPFHPGPVYSSKAYAEWPALVEFPLRDVLQATGGFAYLNTTVAYAVAFAMYLGVKELSLYGCDFTYPNAHVSESGRACVEHLMGIAAIQGMKFDIPTTSTLMDAHLPEGRRLYGYAEEIRVDVVNGRVTLITGPQPEAVTASVSPGPTSPAGTEAPCT